jgi:hypothetical protein
VGPTLLKLLNEISTDFLLAHYSAIIRLSKNLLVNTVASRAQTIPSVLIVEETPVYLTVMLERQKRNAHLQTRIVFTVVTTRNALTYPNINALTKVVVIPIKSAMYLTHSLILGSHHSLVAPLNAVTLILARFRFDFPYRYRNHTLTYRECDWLTEQT